MTAANLLAELARLGCALSSNGDRLHFRAPKGAITPELRAAIVANKPEILALLTPTSKAGRLPGSGREAYHHVSDHFNEWYTPAEHVDAARLVMGEITLDPATSKEAQETVRARRYFTKEANGLSQEWTGNVWLNPPYSMPEVQQFTQKAVEEYRAGRVHQAIVLTNNCTDTGWFHELVAVSSCFCLTRGRIRFHNREKGNLAARQGQAFFYLGANVDAFEREFGRFGCVITLKRAALKERSEPAGSDREELRNAEMLWIVTPPSAPPHIDANGDLHVPLNAPRRYRWWQGGQSVAETLRELNASPAVIARYVITGETVCHEP